MNEKILLIGNDINNATESYSWNDLINGLLQYAEIDNKVHIENKPFPLLYEEIYLKSHEIHNTSESRLKKYIASQTRKLNPNLLHSLILDLKIENILTTNYDLLFEKASSLSTKKWVNKGFIKENLYSLFRFHKTQYNNIWHIHGSETSTRSITLGYEHYSGYLQQMRNYIANGTKGTYKKKDFESLSRRIKNNNVTYESWVDFFFTHDVHIFGLNLDFVEMHLWWLLTFRARAKIENRLEINNTIYYYYPKKYEQSSKYKLDMFNALGVKTIPERLIGNNKVDYYKKIIKKIKNS